MMKIVFYDEMILTTISCMEGRGGMAKTTASLAPNASQSKILLKVVKITDRIYIYT